MSTLRIFYLETEMLASYLACESKWSYKITDATYFAYISHIAFPKHLLLKKKVNYVF